MSGHNERSSLKQTLRRKVQCDLYAFLPYNHCIDQTFGEHNSLILFRALHIHTRTSRHDAHRCIHDDVYVQFRKIVHTYCTYTYVFVYS